MNYYRKFSWFWIMVASIVASLLLTSTLDDSFNPRISIFYVTPDVVIIIMMIVLLSYIPIYFITRKLQLLKLEKIWRILTIVLIIVVLLDRLILDLISTFLDTIELDKNPREFIPTMIYMAYNSRRIWLNGILGTLKVSFIGTAVGFLLAILLVFLRIQKPDKRDSEFKQLLKLLGNTFASVYVTVIRGTPMMVQALIIYYGGFELTQRILKDATVSEVTAVWTIFTAGLICVSLNTTAYISEVLRGGIEALDKGQSEAASSLGFTPWQTLMKVVFPQAVKNSIPAICNEFIINIKDTAVLNVIGVSELMFCTNSVAGTYYKYFEVYCITAVIYLILTFGLSKALNWLSKRMEVPQSTGIPSSN